MLFTSHITNVIFVKGCPTLNDTGTQQEWYVDKNISKRGTLSTTDAEREDICTKYPKLILKT
jgi:hypothetical protein